MKLGDETVGVLLFRNIFAAAPSTLELFSFASLAADPNIDLYGTPELK